MADPRTTTKASTINEVVQDRAIRHATFLQRFKTSETNRIISFLNKDVYPSILEKLQRRLDRVGRGFDVGPNTTRRLAELVRSIDIITKQGFTEARDKLASVLVELGKDEAVFQLGVMKGSVPVSLEFVLPSAAQLKSIVFSRPFQGQILREWFTNLTRSSQTNIKKQLQIGLAAGESNNQILQRIRGTRAAGFSDGILGVSRREAEAVVRTAITHVSNHSREQFFDDNSEFIKSVQWVSTLDTRTCPQCMALDGQVFAIGKGPRPPAHFRCRCTTTPVLKSFRELGLPIKELPPGTRASLNGAVSEKLTFNQWLKKQPKSIQVKALGPTRTELFRKGKLNVTDFVDRKNKPLNLKQIRVEESDAFEKAGL